ncbi:Disease resistance protein [Quillaja saponaria]|uniref:Disease resistance protein n=1 Tax=Quillaja saponaria TaxID=32244 RepID=A0AAD7QB81_QUISA|nr:Disease resistance protein [Quillaja saponaria]
MASESDVARFLTEKFASLFEEVQAALPLPILFRSKLLKIKKFRNENKNIWSSPSPGIISCLYELNDEIAECRIHTHKCNQLSKKFKLPFGLFFAWSIWIRLSTIISKLDDLKKEPRNPTSIFSTGRQTRLVSDALEVVGYDEYEKKIVGWLSDSGFKAIGVSGMAGTGKTALVQKILSSPSVCEKFWPILWVCLSNISSGVDLNLDGKIADDIEKADIQGKIVKYLLKELDYDVDESTGNLSNIELLDILKLYFVGTKYLIVLDDVWHRDDWFCNLGSQLAQNEKYGDRFSHALPKDTGGAVIVTSRVKAVVEDMVEKEYLINFETWETGKGRMLLETIVKENIDSSHQMNDVAYPS